MITTAKRPRVHKFLTALVCTTVLASASVAVADWNPEAFADEDVLEFFTVNEAGEEHWAKVWFVMIDGDPYIRLGGRAEERIRGNVHAPNVKIRVGGQVFDPIVVEPTLDRSFEVAERMGDKYWTAMFMRFMPDRYTARLVSGVRE